MKPVLTGLGLNGVFIFLGNTIGLPWQAVVMIVVTTVVATVVVALVQSVVPQRSGDRLRLLSLLVSARRRATAISRRRADRRCVACPCRVSNRRCSRARVRGPQRACRCGRRSNGR
jgi:hypothetical protein